MTNNLKLELKTIDTKNGNTEFTHHFHFNTDENKVLILTIGNHEYLLTHDGKPLNTNADNQV